MVRYSTFCFNTSEEGEVKVEAIDEKRIVLFYGIYFAILSCESKVRFYCYKN